MGDTVAIVAEATADQFRLEVQPSRRPALLRGLDFGACVDKWKDVSYLSAHGGHNKEVSVHVGRDPLMDFRAKNFSYQNMSFGQLVARASQNKSIDSDQHDKSDQHDESDQHDGHKLNNSPSYVYLRALGEARGKRGRHEPALLEKDWPSLAEDFQLPEGLFEPERLFSSVLRVSSADVAIWPHFDVMDNIYVQVVGAKRFVMWPPSDASKLYLDGDKSRVVNVDQPDLKRFPLFSQAKRMDVTLAAGDALFIPSHWFHATRALNFGVAVNIFWREISSDGYYDPNDACGNRPPLPAARAMRGLDSALAQLNALPDDIRQFYAGRMLDKIQEKCFSSSKSPQ
jgi:tRNA wybutosine-synthesizing protein 5